MDELDCFIPCLPCLFLRILDVEPCSKTVFDYIMKKT